ncbi:MAG: nitrate reductase molybdenum cofactor assembly chaperone [Candidatus Omnitrophica bacterium]|nr:nitrate reductase molybdenum cofactor assembly chaperone [Candidatus Omnitrophota bacterium]
MKNQGMKQELYSQMGILLEYPLNDYRGMLQALISQIEPMSSNASNYLKDFYSKMKRMDLTMWQEYYVQSFDMMPRCSLYLSVHLFGEESFKRAELMAGLKAVYEKHKEFQLTELPDHAAVVLRENILFDDEEWADLCSMCILPALEIMISKLEKDNNAYAFILKAVQSLLVEMEPAHV